jgi:hypothetical protein
LASSTLNVEVERTGLSLSQNYLARVKEKTQL